MMTDFMMKAEILMMTAMMDDDSSKNGIMRDLKPDVGKNSDDDNNNG